MQQVYEQLFHSVSQIDAFRHMAHFVAMQGSHYADAGCRFLLIGKSVNGWGEMRDTSSAASFGYEAEMRFRDTSRWGWVKERNGALYSARTLDKKKPYCLDQKPFWLYSRAIFESLCGRAGASSVDDLWLTRIAWSNLYKLSPDEGGNPDSGLMEAQLPACRDILRRELELLQPQYVLIMTGHDWFSPFAEVFEQVEYHGKNKARGKHQNDVFVEATARYGNAKVVVTCRPEFRDKDTFVGSILSAYR